MLTHSCSKFGSLAAYLLCDRYVVNGPKAGNPGGTELYMSNKDVENWFSQHDQFSARLSSWNPWCDLCDAW